MTAPVVELPEPRKSWRAKIWASLTAAFQEKPLGNGVSMSRCIAALFAVSYAYDLTRGAHDTMGWPFAALGIVIVLAVPLQMLFKTVQTWLASAPGQKVLEKLAAVAVEKIGSAVTGNASPTTVNFNPPPETTGAG